MKSQPLPYTKRPCISVDAGDGVVVADDDGIGSNNDKTKSKPIASTGHPLAAERAYLRPGFTIGCPEASNFPEAIIVLTSR